MANIPQLSTGLPTPKAQPYVLGVINRNNTTSKDLFYLRAGEMITQIGFYGQAISNAATTATLSIGLKVLNNAGTAAGPLLAVQMNNIGSGYTSVPAVSFSGGGGTGAAATAVLQGGQVAGVVVTSYGSGYTSAPTVTFTGGSPTVAATATAIVPISNAIVNAFDLKVTGVGQQTPSTAARALFVPMPFDVVVTGIYAETGTASTSGGPWFIEIGKMAADPSHGGYFPAV